MPRLDHLVARNVPCSRAEARRLIRAGSVSAGDDSELHDPGQDIPRERLPLAVAIDRRPFALHNSCHALLNKPPGVVTALRDPRHEVAYTLLRDAPLFHELRPIGRLDLDTTGLLLWTTDGAWLQHLTHPKRAIPRTYQVALERPFREPAPGGLTLDDGHRPHIVELRALGPGQLHPSLARPADAAVFATVTIAGGAHHEVKRIFAALGSHVLALCRVRFERMTLPADIALGACAPLPRTTSETVARPLGLVSEGQLAHEIVEVRGETVPRVGKRVVREVDETDRLLGLGDVRGVGRSDGVRDNAEPLARIVRMPDGQRAQAGVFVDQNHVDHAHVGGLGVSAGVARREGESLRIGQTSATRVASC